MAEFPTGISQDMTADEALNFTLAFVDTMPDDEALCMAALTIGEPLIDWHWATIADQFVTLAAERSDLRKMISCCVFDESVPEDLRDRLHALVGPEDDVGDRPSTGEKDNRPTGIYALAPDLGARLDAATPERIARAVLEACRIAVQASGYESPDVAVALERLAEPQAVRADTGALVDRLRDDHWRLNGQSDAHSLGESSHEDDKRLVFQQACAAAALASALDQQLPDFAARALFDAGFATADRDETWRRLAANL